MKSSCVIGVSILLLAGQSSGNVVLPQDTRLGVSSDAEDVECLLQVCLIRV